MTIGKDSAEVIRFMALFAKLRDWIDDDPRELESLATGDERLKSLCDSVGFAASLISMNERRRRRLFAAPVDPEFITAWRDYESRYATPVASVFFLDSGFELDSTTTQNTSRSQFLWQVADSDAESQAAAISEVIRFAQDQVGQEWHEYPDGFVDKIEDGVAALDRLTEEVGLDL